MTLHSLDHHHLSSKFSTETSAHRNVYIIITMDDQRDILFTYEYMHAVYLISSNMGHFNAVAEDSLWTLLICYHCREIEAML